MVAFLSSIKVLGYFDEPVFLELVKHTDTFKVPAGESVLRLNPLSKALYVVTRGLVRVSADGDDPKQGHLLNEVGPGGSIMSLFNVLAILTGMPSVELNVTAVAAEDTDVIMVPLEAFSRLAEKHPNAVPNIVQVIVARFQRVTFLTLNKYFGLTSELLSVEANFNRPAKGVKVHASPSFL